ncbi:hypothetical protein P152DRAFT_476135 [Eremomyces bilateralis CBS 781.70]|uniref:Zn(2)-C6 fungal-type domain-containing protein n=1 Tax=Eremomyces bilateralis CBS 781.70 TaxID=1392243 RepID=A0A6G1FV97_9PEZI|nr:uncharacterized protein P152DRAFT_476135 [Eremomyces bilateralis CBS 781.70]KAF1809714.1 hypothetical protein P152DRAFT_476135 [Eremomyces bilateralis CBS 781.70]
MSPTLNLATSEVPKDCDEKKPSCSNCDRNLERCSLTFIYSSRQAAAARPTPISRTSHGAAISPLSSYGSDAAGSSDVVTQGHFLPQFSVRDMELLFHFTSSTSKTLSLRRPMQKIYGTVFPRLAFSNPFLLRAILAVSALHMARKAPPEKAEELLRIASEHQNIGLASYRVAIGDINQHSCDALFAFALLLFVHVCAASDLPDSGQEDIPESHPNSAGGSVVGTPPTSASGTTDQPLGVEWIRMARGVRVLLEPGKQWLMRGQLSMFFNMHQWKDEMSDIDDEMRDDDEHLKSLAKLWDSFAEDPDREEDVRALNDAIFQLRLAHQRIWIALRAVPPDASISRIKGEDAASAEAAGFTWLYMLPERYVALIEEKCPESLIILAHFAVLLGKIPHLWWSERRSTALALKVKIIMEPRWWPWLEWPMSRLSL